MKKLYFSLLFALIAMNSAFAWMPAVNTTIYFKPNAAWQEDGATFELHFYSSGNVAKTMTLVVGTLDVYEALITSTELSGNTDFEIRRKVGSTQAANVYNLAGVNWDNGNCYELNGSLSKTANASAPSNGTMSTYTPPPPTAPTVTLTVTPTTVSVGGQVTLTNETVNFSGTPSIEYQVKFGTGGTYTTCTSPYTCTTMGDYYFKAIATYNSENATSTEKKVTANCFPHEGDVIYFKPIGWWFNGSVNFKANFSGGTTPVTIDFVLIEGDDSNIGNPDSRTGNVYALTVTAAAATNTTLNFQRGTYNTITGLENVDWCNYNCVNMTTVYEGAYNAGNSPMIVYTPPTTDPTVTLTLTPSTNPLLVNGTVALSATNSYFTNPGSVTYTYYVKLPSQPDYEALPITSPYTVTELGTYSFKVVGTEGLETDDDVKTILSTEPVKIRFKKPDSWASVYIYAWGGVPTSNTFGDWPGTTDANPSCDGWYEVTLPAGVTSIGNVIFNNNSGSQFDADNVTSAAACYTLTTSAATAVACPVPQPQSLLLAASATDVGIGATVILTPAPENICTPTYTYYVQVPGGSFVEIGSNTYNSFTVAGDYTFKVVETGTNLESDEIIVTVHANVTVKATLNEGVIWDGVMVYSWIGGTNSDEVADDANYHDACNNQTLWFSQEVPYGSNVIFHNAYEGGQWGDGHQAIELLNVINDECYILSYGSDSYGHLDRNVVDCPVNTSLLSDNPITIKVKKSNDWNGVVGLHIHYWNACVDNISPMVEKCYNNGETDETWYEYELSGSPTNIAILLYSTFGASDQQTEDIISVSTSTCYVLNEGSGGSYGNKGYTGSSCPLDVPCTATGTPTVTAQKEILSVQYFSITGQSVSENFNGFVIKKTIYKDGTNSSEKLFLK